MKKYIAFISFIFFIQCAYADIKIEASAPGVVEVNEQFRLSYVINSQDINDFGISDLNDFEIDMGPSTSRQSSVQIINGKMTKNSSVTYTYILRAIKEGDFTIPPAKARVDGKEYSSNPIKIKVIKGSSSSQGSQGGQTQRMRTQSAGAQITANDLFITVTANKRRVYEQEAVLLTYKVYSLVNLSQLAGGIPDLEGFHTQEIELPQQKNLKMEEYNGKSYGTVVWRQYVLFPQRSGKLTIPSVDFDAIVVQHNRNIDPFEAFFNGGSTMVEVKKTVKAPSITLDVMSLPEKPADFSGAVGHFKIKSEISTTDLKANDALTLKLTVSGSGNMKLMKSPKVQFPNDFETYDAKVSDNVKIGREGASGDKSFEYIAVPRHPGTYTIPAVNFCYFDTKDSKYKTITTESYTVNVGKSSITANNVSSNYTNREDVRMLASDVRYIHLGDSKIKPSGQIFFGSFKYLMCYIVSFSLFVILIVVYRKRVKENSNIAKVKNKKANKVATRRLKRASQLLKQNNASELYSELLKALWGYFGDKLNIPTSELNKEIIAEQLSKKGVQEDEINSVLETMNECEYARYSQGSTNHDTMAKVFESASEVISKIENSLK